MASRRFPGPAGVTAGHSPVPERTLSAGFPDRVSGLRHLVEYLLVAAAHGDLRLGGGPVPQPDAQDVRVDGKRLLSVARRPSKRDVMIPLVAGSERLRDLPCGSYGTG